MIKTLLFGGSFDPIHNGHLNIALKTFEEIKADKLVFIPSKSPRWKSPDASDQDRLNMCRIALKDIPNAELSLIEMNSSSEINYTYKTILSYEKKEDEILYYLIGFDQLEKLDKWYEIDKLSKLVHFVVYNRPSYIAVQENIEKYHVLLLKSGYRSTMSSTKARKGSQLDLPLGVLHYIEDHNLYYIKKIKSYLSEKRYNHVLSVAHLSYDVAEANGLNPHKAYLAALLHDIGKEIPYGEQKAFMDRYYPEYSEILSYPLYHQFLSCEIARKEFFIEDEEILNAIKYHASGNRSMSILGKIVYACDKVEPTRKFDTRPYIEALKKDIESGFIFVLKTNIEYLKEKKQDYSNPLTLKCIKEYLGKEEKIYGTE